MRLRLSGLAALPVALAALAIGAGKASAEPAECLSVNPPAPAKPYFLFLIDTSGSMQDSLTPAPSCNVANGYASNYPANKSGHARCAMYNTLNAFGGQVNFGLMAFPGVKLNDTSGDNPATCPDKLGYQVTVPGCTYPQRACGEGTGATRSASTILSPIPQDNYWDPPGSQAASNLSFLLSLNDNKCGDCQEVPTSGVSTPINGGLRDAYRYLSGTFSIPASNGTFTQSYSTPLVGAGKERPCRSVNVILLTDGIETCDDSPVDNSPTGTGPVNAAKRLLDGFTVGGVTWKVKTNVIQFGPDDLNETNAATATAGGTTAIAARNETELSQALASIISGAIKPEVCDNTDNNCNGCTDEGFTHYCNRGKTARTIAQIAALPAAGQRDPSICCNGVRGTFDVNTTANDTTCLGAYRARLATNPDQPAVSFLPCDIPAAGDLTPETHWLCANPGEVCDEVDNNCDSNYNATPTLAYNSATKVGNQLDEQQKKCLGPGNKLACPTAEVCDNYDNNCDGVIDNQSGQSTPYGICAGGCQAVDELCNGCDENCNNTADDGVPDLPCAAPGGLDSTKAPKCQSGFRRCDPKPVSGPKACVAGAPKDFYGACQYPGAVTEICGNGQDDDCDGLIDEGSNTPCFPFAGIDPKNVDGLQGPVPTSRCKAGVQSCAQGAVCEGAVGPLTYEVCNGIDDDCDGKIDEAEDLPAGTIGKDCGTNTGKCTTGKTACVGGTLVCQGGSQPSPELCNGVDDDCNGKIDDNVVDGPDTSVDMMANRCWAGNPPDAQGKCEAGETVCDCPSVGCAGLTWCAPPGATCNTLGSLAGQCALGVVQCKNGGFVCDGGKLPSAEVCDNLDNDCDGVLNNGVSGTVPCNQGPGPGGTWPGGACKPGTLTCGANSQETCLDDQGQPVVVPSDEVCDGVDNDCDGTIDEGIALSDLPCVADYDKTLYPGERTAGACKPGTYQCVQGGNNGQQALTCVGGVGPQPEICDGVDNDCDGLIDEEGAAPDGITGTANPLDATQLLGGECTYGLDPATFKAACKPGAYACISGKFLCTGGDTPGPEVCDCKDNDCDGKIDEDVDSADGPLDVCTGGDKSSARRCVNADGLCQCASPCIINGEFKECPLNYECTTATRSADQAQLPNYCVTDADAACGDCSKKRVPATGTPECGPDGQVNGTPLPVCVCKGTDGCHAPCHNVTCDQGLVCTNFGTKAGTCVENTCLNTPCPTGFLCDGSKCISDPCAKANCAATEACVPSADLSSATCKASCAGVNCPDGEACKGGKCEPTGCATACASGKVCDGTACVDDKCKGVECSGAFAVCDPLTGQCGVGPCNGVQCPGGQVCAAGECVAQSGTGGAGGSAGASGSSGQGGSAGASGATGGSGGTSPTGVGGGGGVVERGTYGQATGGGGCAVSPEATGVGSWLGLGLGLMGLVRRRQARTSKENG